MLLNLDGDHKDHSLLTWGILSSIFHPLKYPHCLPIQHGKLNLECIFLQGLRMPAFQWCTKTVQGRELYILHIATPEVLNVWVASLYNSSFSSFCPCGLWQSRLSIF